MKNKISYKMVENPSSPLPKGFLAELPRIFEEQGATIYQKRNKIKLFELNGLKISVKEYGVPPLLNRFLYSVGLRTPKAKRTYENAAKILERGFCTPRQYGYILVYKNGWLAESFSAGEFIENVQSVEDAHHDEELRQAFAHYTADLHARGLMHRDYILNNILYVHDDKGYKFILIDINRFVFRNKPIRGFLQYVNLMQPFANHAELQKFVSDYAKFAHASSSLYRRVAFCRKWRTRYSELKHLLKKIPGIRSFYEYHCK